MLYWIDWSGRHACARVDASLDPVLVNVPSSDVKMSCVSFAQNSDCLLVGDNNGQTSVFQLRGMKTPSDNQVNYVQSINQTNTCLYIASESDFVSK